MANELSFNNLESDAGLAHYLAGLIHAKLHDPTDLRGLMQQVPFTGGMGSETIKVPQYSPAHAFAAASTEISGGHSNTSIGSGNAQLTVARRVLKFQLTQLWQMVAPTGSLDLDLLAQVFVGATGQTITDMLVALFPSLTSNTAVGSQTADMSVDVQDDAMFSLNIARVSGKLAMVLMPKAYNEWFASLSTLGGGRQYKQDVQDALAARGPGLKGVIGDIEVWDSDSIGMDSGSSYYRQAMFGMGCFAYTEASASLMAGAIPPNVFRIDAGEVLITHSYVQDDGLTTVNGDYYPAVSEQEDARGVEIQSQVA